MVHISWNRGLALLEGVLWSDILQVHPNLLMSDLWIKYRDEGHLVDEVLHESDRGRFTSVARVRLECKPENSDFLETRSQKYSHL